MARKYQITEELYNYAVEHSLKEPYITVELRDETFATERAARMVSSPEQMQFISMLLKILKPKKSIEIGVFTGYSTLWMAMALPDDAKIIAKAHDTLDAILKNDNELETYDFIYIDADKLGYIDYLDKCHKLLRQGGLMIFDNVFLFGEVTKTEHVNDVLPNAMKEFNKHLHKDERFDISMLPLGDGMTLAYKK